MNEYDEDLTHELEHERWLKWYLGEWMEVLDLRDPDTEPAFLKALKEQGIPCG